MNDPGVRFAELLRRDRRYAPQAYEFIREALSYAQDVLDLGTNVETDDAQCEQHLSGQELCEAVRKLALDNFGLMARTVLGAWGIKSTSDIGEIVYNLIDIGVMRKSPHDRRDDFDDVYEFDDAFDRSFEIKVPD